jgi:2-polyprenyl-6-methoxyphenol hydroxylase-like FAD-dependent oxidoreductase
VFERQTSASENLAGYGIHIDRHGRQALHDCLPPHNWDRFMAASTHAGTELFFRDERLRLLANRDDAVLSGRPASEVERRGIGRLELRDVLLEGLTAPAAPVVQWGKTYTHFEQIGGGRVRAHFEDGTGADGDLLVGADASHSKVRQQYLPNVRRVDLGILTVAGRYILNEESTRALPKVLTDGSLNNIVPAGKGWMFVSAWHSRPADIAGNRQEAENYVVWAYIAPKSEYPANAESLKAAELRDFVATRIKGWSPDLNTLVGGADMATLAPVVLRTMPPLEPWQPSNVTVLGDAIHNMTPMAGIGANSALRDANLLRDVLSDGAGKRRTLIDAIGEYENRMRDYANKAVGLSRRNAESASSDKSFQRCMLRTLLRLAQTFPPIMHATLGRSAREA